MTLRSLRAAALAAALLTTACAAPGAGPADGPSAAVPAAAADASGTYEFTGDMRGEAFQGAIRLARGDAGAYTGTLTTSLTGQMPVRAVDVQGSRIRVTADGRMGEAVITLEMSGREFTGNWTYGPGGGTLTGRMRTES